MLKNKTKNKIIANNTKLCRNIFLKSLGLMFSSPKTVKDRALIFGFSKEKRTALHMLFVFYPIDVIFIDGKKRVVEIATLRPFCISYLPKKKAKYIIECRKGCLKKGNVRVGDKISF